MTAPRRIGWGREYPPLLLSSLLMLLMLAVLPSALNLPQSEPAETLEYAPIPPEDQDLTPPAGNFSSLGLGSSSGLTASETAEPDPPPGIAGGGRAVKTAGTKRCVGDPPRQTEDPLSPPCSAVFNGDNHGATYQGVTGDEIRILVYQDGNVGWATYGNYPGYTEPNRLVDLGLPPRDDENIFEHNLRVWQQYFNDRYQTYGRSVRLWSYTSSGTRTAEIRRSDAAEVFAKVKPFAAVTYLYFGNEDPFIEEMARRGVLNFGSFFGRPQSLFQKFPKLIWGFMPSIEQQALQFASMVCTQVVPYPVSFSGNVGENGKPRRFGLISTTDPTYPGLRVFRDLVKTEIEACGGQFVAEATYRWNGHYSYTNEEEAPLNMAAFRDKGVTTVIWPGGHETGHSRSAAAIGYRPEWVLAGDRANDASNAAMFQDNSVWEHAWVLSHEPLLGELRSRPCYVAFKEVDQQAADNDVDFYACRPFWESLRQLFTGIQVAGPRLDPTTIDRGFHAIPAGPSGRVDVPACYYEPGDYTCVKDAALGWWGFDQNASTNTKYCWKMVEGGRRFVRGQWPKVDLPQMKRPENPCNSHRANQ